jgi:hypothetical protein
VRGLRWVVRATLQTMKALRESARTKIGQVSMNERVCPCADHAYGLRGSQWRLQSTDPIIHLFSDLKERMGRVS